MGDGLLLGQALPPITGPWGKASLGPGGWLRPRKRVKLNGTYGKPTRASGQLLTSQPKQRGQ